MCTPPASAPHACPRPHRHAKLLGLLPKSLVRGANSGTQTRHLLRQSADIFGPHVGIAGQGVQLQMPGFQLLTQWFHGGAMFPRKRIQLGALFLGQPLKRSQHGVRSGKTAVPSAIQPASLVMPMRAGSRHGTEHQRNANPSSQKMTHISHKDTPELLTPTCRVGHAVCPSLIPGSTLYREVFWSWHQQRPCHCFFLSYFAEIKDSFSHMSGKGSRHACIKNIRG